MARTGWAATAALVGIASVAACTSFGNDGDLGKGGISPGAMADGGGDGAVVVGGPQIVLNFDGPPVLLTGEKATANARAINLLRAVGLEHRFAPSFSAQKAQALMHEEIDWDAVAQRLAELRQAGQVFLSTQLQAVPA